MFVAVAAVHRPDAAIAAVGPVPYAAGDSAGNIALRRHGDWVVTRWVARHTGTLSRLYIQARVRGSTCDPGGPAGYAAGTSGTWLVTTHRVRPDGRPELRRTLAAQRVVPCRRQINGSVALTMNLRVRRGDELATVIRNVDPDAARNWASQNFLYAARGLVGANAANTRAPGRAGSAYGLDDRELVGFSRDCGRTWALPGGPYGPGGGRAFVPTYLQEYRDGHRSGQFHYTAHELAGPVTMVYPRVPVPWRITSLGAYTSGPGAALVRLVVDGRDRASAVLGGVGVLRSAIAPVIVPPGSRVEVVTTAGPGALALREVYTQDLWDRMLRTGRGGPYFLAQNPRRAAPVYPLPAYRGVDDRLTGRRLRGAGGPRAPRLARPAPDCAQ